MQKCVQLFYFSPTGGTRTAAEALCAELSEKTISVDLCAAGKYAVTSCDLAVIAMPVFGGRIPTVAAERLRSIDGAGKKAVTMVIFGNRAYEDALLELNDVAKACGFQVVASAAVVAQHSIVPEVGYGRPDQEDRGSIAEFANKIRDKMEKNPDTPVTVPGNTPYKNGMKMQVTPVSVSACDLCGNCVAVCPTNAICFDGERLTTDREKCILCMACTAACPQNARILPAELQEKMNQMLMRFAAVRSENDYFL